MSTGENEGMSHCGDEGNESWHVAHCGELCGVEHFEPMVAKSWISEMPQSLWLFCKCRNIFFCFLHSTCAFFFFSQMNVCNKKIHCVRGDEIPLCYSLGNWLINIFIVPLNVVLDFSVKLFQVMKSSWLASLKCVIIFPLAFLQLSSRP